MASPRGGTRTQYDAVPHRLAHRRVRTLTHSCRVTNTQHAQVSGRPMHSYFYIGGVFRGNGFKLVPGLYGAIAGLPRVHTCAST